MSLLELPSVDSNATCLYNGSQLKLSLGQIEYAGKPLFHVDGCVLENGTISALVGPNGVGKTSLARLIASKTLPGFPQSLSTQYVEPYQSKRSVENLTPEKFLLHGVNQRLEELSEEIEALEGKLNEDTPPEGIENVALRLGFLCELEEELLATNHAEIDSILEELGFAAANLLLTPVSKLSSGWRYKCILANALVAQPDLLVLDEPSFLDSSSLEWLVNRVKELSHNGTIVLLISHKESLLEVLATRILFINASSQLETYNCGYSAFKEARSKMEVFSQKECVKGAAKQENAANSLKSVQQRLARSERNNQKKIAEGEDKRFIRGKCKEGKQRVVKSAVAKVKLLKREVDRLEELAKASKVHKTSPIVLEASEWAAGQPLISAQDVSFSYRPNEPGVIGNINLAIFANDRIALTGANGQGKSTLIKLLLGELVPQTGTVQRASGLRVAYFPQDAIQRLSNEYGNLSAVELIQSKFGDKMQELDARNHLGQFGLKGNLGLNKIQTLSAGQRTRLYLSLIFFPGSVAPSLLILDEVENLDSETTTALLESLSVFKGAVLCVSHDIEHLERLKPRQRWSLKGGKISEELVL